MLARRGETVTLHIRVDTGETNSSNDPIYRDEDVDRARIVWWPPVLNPKRSTITA